MNFHIKTFKIPKTNETFDDCHDAYSMNTEKGLFAISDGVSKSFFPATWSKLLVNFFLENYSVFFKKDVKEWNDCLNPIRKEWIQTVKKNIKDREAKEEKIPYHVYNRLIDPLEYGAATFAGLQIEKKENELHWQLSIVGDSCLFIINEQNELQSFLNQKTSEFDNHPDFLASRKIQNPKNITCQKGIAQIGDKFILATDALAEWILKNHEENHLTLVLDEFAKINTIDDFDKFIYEYRKGLKLPIIEEDDTTLLMIEHTEKDTSVYEKPEDWISTYNFFYNETKVQDDIFDIFEKLENKDFKKLNTTIHDEMNQGFKKFTEILETHSKQEKKESVKILKKNKIHLFREVLSDENFIRQIADKFFAKMYLISDYLKIKNN